MIWDAMLQVELGWMQSFHALIWSCSWTGPTMIFLTKLGTAEFGLGIIALVGLLYDQGKARRLALLLMVGMLINATLKDFVQEARPFAYLPQLSHYHAPDSYSFPSGHSEFSMILYGTFAMWEWGSWRRWLYLSLIALVGVSRVALGMHFPSDILVGWFEGFIILWLSCWWLKTDHQVVAAIKSKPLFGIGLGAVFVLSVLQVVDYGFIWLVGGALLGTLVAIYRPCAKNLNGLSALAQGCGFIGAAYLLSVAVAVSSVEPGLMLLGLGVLGMYLLFNWYACLFRKVAA